MYTYPLDPPGSPGDDHDGVHRDGPLRGDMCVYVYIYIYMYMYICICICVYIHVVLLVVLVCIYIYIYIYTCIHLERDVYYRTNGGHPGATAAAIAEGYGQSPC